MRVYNNYILSIAVLLCGVNAVLAFAGQEDLSVYFILNVLAYLIVTLLFVYVNPRAKFVLNSIGAILFGGFVIIVVMKVMEYLSAS
jgi:hypothetical protein